VRFWPVNERFNQAAIRISETGGSWRRVAGHSGARIAKLDKDGKFLMDWGEAGERLRETRPAYFNFNNDHGVAFDTSLPRVPVNGRKDRRSRQFDQNGALLELCTDGDLPASIFNSFITGNDNFRRSDAGNRLIMKRDLNGRRQQRWNFFGDARRGQIAGD
jgi:hypothetical protein